MLSNTINIVLLIILYSFTFSQISSSIDTIYLSKNQNIYKLKNKLILANSLIIEKSDSLIIPLSIDSINGEIQVPKNNFDNFI